MPDEDPRRELASLIALNSRDWGTDEADAWLYGIVLGWGPDPDDPESGSALPDLARRHGWTPQQVARLERLHTNFERLKLPGDEPATSRPWWRARARGAAMTAAHPARTRMGAEDLCPDCHLADG